MNQTGIRLAFINVLLLVAVWLQVHYEPAMPVLLPAILILDAGLAILALWTLWQVWRR